MRSSPLARLVQKLPLILVLVALGIGLLIVRTWAYVTTYRLYLSQRAGAASRSAAAQRFDIEGARVLPQIVTREDDLIAFKTAIGRPSMLQVDVRPAGRATYEVRWRTESAIETLARGDTAASVSLAIAIPAQESFSFDRAQNRGRRARITASASRTGARRGSTPRTAAISRATASQVACPLFTQ